MKIKLDKLVSMQQSLNRITSLELPPKVSYRLSKTLKKVLSELKDLEVERKKLFNKYAQPDEKGVPKVPEDKIETFSAEWATLLQEEVELEGIAKVTLPDDVKISAREAMDLEDLLELTE